MPLQANNIQLLMLCCTECNYQFRSEIPIYCIQCGANAIPPTLNPYERETLFALVHSNPYRNDKYDNWNYNHYQEKMEFRNKFKLLLEGYGWYDHSRITIQACWIALFVLDTRDNKIIFALSFFEDAFSNAPPTDEAEIEDALYNDIWEHKQTH
jgi:hypothetical protein